MLRNRSVGRLQEGIEFGAEYIIVMCEEGMNEIIRPIGKEKMSYRT